MTMKIDDTTAAPPDQLGIPADLKRERTAEGDAKVQQHVADSKKRTPKLKTGQTTKVEIVQALDAPAPAKPKKGKKKQLPKPKDEPEVVTRKTIEYNMGRSKKAKHKMAKAKVAANQSQSKTAKGKPVPKSGEYGEISMQAYKLACSRDGVSRKELDLTGKHKIRHQGNEAWRKLFTSMSQHFDKKLSEKKDESRGIVFRIA
jgi:hypothetical protein